MYYKVLFLLFVDLTALSTHNAPRKDLNNASGNFSHAQQFQPSRQRARINTKEKKTTGQDQKNPSESRTNNTGHDRSFSVLAFRMTEAFL
jgi:hypothetical protein